MWEAVYIIEGLLKNESKAEPGTIHADTQSQSYPVHALCWRLSRCDSIVRSLRYSWEAISTLVWPSASSRNTSSSRLLRASGGPDSQKEKDYLVRVGTRLAIVSGVVLTAGMTGILVLISNVVFGTATAVVVGTVVASGVLGCGSGSR